MSDKTNWRGLKHWLEEHRLKKGDTFTYVNPKTKEKKTGTIQGRVEKDNLTSIQDAHLNGSMNIYQPVEAYSEKWIHNKMDESNGTPRNHHEYGKFISAHPVPGTKRRNDLPPIYLQWKEDYRKRHVIDRGK